MHVLIFVFQFKTLYISAYIFILFVLYAATLCRHFVFVCRPKPLWLCYIFYSVNVYFLCVYVCLARGTRNVNFNVAGIKNGVVYGSRFVCFFPSFVVVFNVSFICWRFEWEKNTLHDQMILLYLCVGVFSTAFFWIRLKYAVGKLHDTF